MEILSSFLLSGLDYSIQRRRELETHSSLLVQDLGIHAVTRVDNDQFEKSFIYLVEDISSVSEAVKNINSLINGEFDRKNITARVFKTADNIISRLPESILLKISNDNIYSTDYGTLIIDWESTEDFSDDEFSLEIGNECIGYFSEHEGEDIVRVEEATYGLAEVALLSKHIEEFYSKKSKI